MHHQLSNAEGPVAFAVTEHKFVDLTQQKSVDPPVELEQRLLSQRDP